MAQFNLRILDNHSVCRCEDCAYVKAWKEAGSPVNLDEKYLDKDFIPKNKLDENILYYLKHPYCVKTA